MIPVAIPVALDRLMEVGHCPTMTDPDDKKSGDDESLLMSDSEGTILQYCCAVLKMLMVIRYTMYMVHLIKTIPPLGW